LFVICYVPEFGSKQCKTISDTDVKTFVEVGDRRGSKVELIGLIDYADHIGTLNGLKSVASYLASPNRKGIVYYYGHDDQIRYLNGDEKNDGNGQDAGYDEIWRTQNIVDDEPIKLRP
jgi:hypothetical protein